MIARGQTSLGNNSGEKCSGTVPHSGPDFEPMPHVLPDGHSNDPDPDMANDHSVSGSGRALCR